MTRGLLRSLGLALVVLLGSAAAPGAEGELPALPALTQPPTEDRLPGKFVWADLFTSEFDAARQFYADTFGWEWRPVSRHAEHRYGVEIDRDRTYVFWDRREGVGGLPVGSEGLLVALLSGGIDSPVAAYTMMARGCRVHLTHFLNRSVGTGGVTEKIKTIARHLSLYHGPIDLSIVPFETLQREIVMVVPARSLSSRSYSCEVAV